MPPEIFRWILPIEAQLHLLQDGKILTHSWAEQVEVQSLLEYLSLEERVKVLRYRFAKDAALSLGSQILKRLAITQAKGVLWGDITIISDIAIKNGKPHVRSPQAFEFNVSHHGKLVALAATTIPNLEIGIDVVEVDLEKDSPAIDRHGGWPGWVALFRDALADAEVNELLRSRTCSTAAPEAELEQKHATFFAYWALKEAYVKMTGEALLGNSLRHIKFEDLSLPPRPLVRAPEQKLAEGQLGEKCTVQVLLHDSLIPDVKIELQWLDHNYLVATALSNVRGFWEPPAFEAIDVQKELSKVQIAHNADRTVLGEK